MVNLQVLISSTTFITVLYTVDTGHCGEVRGIAFTEDQKQTALDIVENKENLSQEQPPSPNPNTSPVVVVAGLNTPQGASHLQLH